MRKLLAVTALALAATFNAQAATVTAFSEDFENGLGRWIVYQNQATTVADPLASGHGMVLSFTGLGSGGSIYSDDFINATGDFTVSFDYLGLPGRGGNAGNLGGFFGISLGSSPFATHDWIAGTQDNYEPPPNWINLIDDGQWHHYTLTFPSVIGQTVRLMYEDFAGSGGVAGDVYFDNIQFNDARVAPAPLGNTVPEPASTALIGLGIAAAVATRRRRS